jgi:response regulator NasT
VRLGAAVAEHGAKGWTHGFAVMASTPYNPDKSPYKQRLTDVAYALLTSPHGQSTDASTLKVMLIDNDHVRRDGLRDSLLGAGYDVITFEAVSLGLMERMGELAPDVIIIETESPDRDTLEHLCAMSRHQPRPVVMFTDDDNEETIRQAIRAGVTSYVVEGIAPEHIRPVLQVALARFQEEQALRRDLETARTQLAERKLVDRAKGVIMRQKGVSEDEAYTLLRKLAMNRRLKLGEVAQQVIDMAELLA